MQDDIVSGAPLGPRVATVDDEGILNLSPTLRNRRVEVIVLPADSADNDIEQKPKRQLGFAKGAELPDSFFEPLPEEELQAWGL